jgi:hypothetical protein
MITGEASFPDVHQRCRGGTLPRGRHVGIEQLANNGRLHAYGKAAKVLGWLTAVAPVAMFVTGGISF